ncbi:unnamed protein product [Gongylonema pulchrum]|uniref:protein-serine/threonine phosphatase n=1 Tax=Gongylonema pulchrum TaxID=637853 RepID=A0A183D596_9BILA|nr:unnamed protein product [Gongylonema pulchrum]
MFYNLNEIFDSMPLVAILSDQIYCCHGGISQFAQYRSDIANIPRKSVWASDIQGYKMKSIFTDTIWAEPHFKQTLLYSPSDRYYSYYFNKSALEVKLRQFKCRALVCGVSSNPNNLSLQTDKNEGSGCEELFGGLCYAIYSSHMDRQRSFEAAVLLFKFNPSTSLLGAEVRYHSVSKLQFSAALKTLKTEFISSK